MADEAERQQTENTEQATVKCESSSLEETAEQELKRTWSPDDIQALLIKAINLRAQIKDIETIIKCGADVNKPISNGLHPLHYAAYTDNVQCVKLLLDAGANVNVTDDIGYTPLHLTARRGNYKSMQILIKHSAIMNFNEPGVEIHHTEEKNKLGYTTTEPVNLAIQNGHADCARLLLENGARPDNKYFMGFEICLVPLDNVECLEVLLKYGANPNVFNRCGLSPLMKASKDHHIDAVRLLVKYGADVNAQCPPLFEQKSVLQLAITSGNIVIINILLDKGARISRYGEYKYNALHTAIIKGRADICCLLLQHGADPLEKTDEGATPLMLACSTLDLKERKEIVELLVACGADINAHAPQYSYFDPYLAPITEYFKNIGNNEDFSIVEILITNGAKVHFCSSEMDMKRRRDPFSILPYAHCMRSNSAIFHLVLTAADKFNPLAIHLTDNLSEDMKNTLLLMAAQPPELKHLVRKAVHCLLFPKMPEKVKHLPIPNILKSYLLYN